MRGTSGLPRGSCNHLHESLFSRSEMTKSPLMKGALLALFLIPVDLFAWTNGELLIWMDADRGRALKAIAAKKFEDDFGLKVTIEAPEKITESFPVAAQMGKGPESLASCVTVRGFGGIRSLWKR